MKAFIAAWCCVFTHPLVGSAFHMTRAKKKSDPDQPGVVIDYKNLTLNPFHWIALLQTANSRSRLSLI